MNRPTGTSEGAHPAGAVIGEFAPRQTLWQRFQRWEWMLVALLALTVVINTRLSPFFLDGRNLSIASSDFMEMGIMMLPMVFIIITGNIDLSVASTMGMSASFMGVLHNHGVNIWIAVLMGLLIGTAGGFLNGFIIARVKVPALVTTLGTYAFFRGVAYVCLGDQAAKGYPEAFTYIGQGHIPGTLIPVSVVIFVLLAIVFGLVLHKTTFGRYLYSIGNNEQAALYSGVSVERVKMIAFTLSGFIAALAGLILAARFGSTRPDIGTGLELSVITAAVLGGVDINGGSGTMLGGVLALLLIGLLRFGMGLKNIQGQVQGVVIGLVLILAILLPNLPREISERNLRINRQFIFFGLVAIACFVLFFVFFFWSRSYGITHLLNQ